MLSYHKLIMVPRVITHGYHVLRGLRKIHFIIYTIWTEICNIQNRTKWYVVGSQDWKTVKVYGEASSFKFVCITLTCNRLSDQKQPPSEADASCDSTKQTEWGLRRNVRVSSHTSTPWIDVIPFITFQGLSHTYAKEDAPCDTWNSDEGALLLFFF